ncbi:MAG TPA: hypothetical protein VKE70_16255 [Candidatus Solibacter sp.]|nr:hypothetical protein [Candidatus Solibacter sp.]
MRVLSVCFLALTALAQQEQTHRSVVMGGPRTYRLFLPASYKSPTKRFPVIYWFHGYEAPDDARDKTFATYAAAHDVILIDSGPADLTGNYPLYFPELIEHIDRTYRTVADRAHRAISGYGAGGYLALWEAARSPDLVGSASSVLAEREAEVGPTAFPVTMSVDDLVSGLADVRVWQINANPDLPAIFDFHLKAFTDPLPKPDVFTFTDPYPNFGIWGWEVESNRRSPGLTSLANVSRAGLRTSVREWRPGGPVVAGVKLNITSPKMYTPGALVPVTYVHIADGKVRHASQKSDSQGRLTFDVDGDEYEIGVGAGSILAVSSVTITDAAWATAAKPVKLKIAFVNKGAVRSATETLKWESPTPGVKFEYPTSRLFGLAPGEIAATQVTFTLAGPPRTSVRLIAAAATGARLNIDVPLYPAAEPATDFQIADGKPIEGYPHELGEGNRDGHASPGETVAILLPDAGSLRAAEVFTNDPCIDTSLRISEAGRRYSLPKLRATCEPGHMVHMLARAGLRYASIEFPVWYRQ